MNKILISFVVILLSWNMSAQELNCKVVVSAEQIVESNAQLFKTMETSISEFMNQTKWTSKTYAQNEKIECSVLLTLTAKQGNDGFTGSIQVQSSRPVYNSIYQTPVLNYKDDDLTFSYIEFQSLQFDVNSYQSDLISTLSYFAYLIIGLDADTFALNGGEEYYLNCQKIVDQVDNPNSKKAWKSNTNKFNRYHFVNKLLSPSFKTYRTSLYNYHLNGLDKMSENTKLAKESVKQSLLDLNSVSQIVMGTQIIRTFMDAKSDEIVDIFTGGDTMDTKDLVSALNKMAPTLATKWEKIK